MLLHSQQTYVNHKLQKQANAYFTITAIKLQFLFLIYVTEMIKLNKTASEHLKYLHYHIQLQRNFNLTYVH